MNASSFVSFVSTPIGQAIVRRTNGHPLEDPVGLKLFEEQARQFSGPVLQREFNEKRCWRKPYSHRQRLTA